MRHRRALLVDALAAAQRLRDRGGEANVLQALGDLALREADLGEARRRYEAALAIYPQIGARLGKRTCRRRWAIWRCARLIWGRRGGAMRRRWRSTRKSAPGWGKRTCSRRWAIWRCARLIWGGAAAL
ncbi:MAG: hypothetical protein H6640_07710 [Caldilineaceae bacterium]|nr:hypothetical protein [Caldilineaceae bacterium]